MNILLEFVATFCTAMFAGAAVYITLVEHPARMECSTALAVAEFAPSYRRATVMQASLAAIAFLAAVGAWLNGTRFAWLLGGILILAVIPYTLIAILPTNKKLLDSSLDRNSDTARLLLSRWGRLHAVRTVLSVVALLVFCSILTMPYPPLSMERAKEAVLRQDLFMLRSLVSQYTLDLRKPPKSLDDLVKAGYLKKIPLDPMTGKPDWRVDQMEIVDPNHEPAICSVHSSSSRISSNGTAYGTW